MDVVRDNSDLEIFSATPIKTIDYNLTDFPIFSVSNDEGAEVTALSDPVYEQFLADVWVGIVLTLMVLSCACFMCSCLVYHKLQEWKLRNIEARNASNVESGQPEADLPSYTIASGLPTYEEALEQLKTVKNICEPSQKPKTTTDPNTTPVSETSSLSVFNLFGLYNSRGNSEGQSSSTKPC
ncbi:protein commissureless 2 homolog [Anthonomus grandis grandis]|uniref:protein commissureless 2 homolog n=1 Tax=Anthonomus grandis grandis TaxID=2921223 RepID=UPI002166BFE1|nr:protein commissureless 2 homolog [Anthonomus grandis grandis]